MNGQLHEVALRKEGHTYVFRFDHVSRPALMGVLWPLRCRSGLQLLLA